MLRTIALNPVEPAVFSARTPKGFDLVMDLLYRTAVDTIYPNDLAATLVLEGRTTNQTKTYIVPATDAVNGKARVRVPGGDLVDDNGYRMTLVGTVDNVRTVVGVGTLILAGTGVEEVVAADVIDTVNLTLDYDEACELDVALWQDAAGGTPFDLTDQNTSVGAAIYDKQGGSALMPFTITVLASNKVGLRLTADQVNALPASCWWSLNAGTSAGTTELCNGTVAIVGTITPPLTIVTYNYDYQKPATVSAPAAGQAVQCNLTQNLLLVAKFDNDAVDRTDTLRLVRVGDEIVLGTTVWSVTDTTEESADFVFEVLPIQQAVASGVNPITFQRPS
jgi:hypothetical protein